jgi:cellulose synthase/poly-beta-1,6-N-acetylglucosamine synthase-like glycosyltransferase
MKKGLTLLRNKSVIGKAEPAEHHTKGSRLASKDLMSRRQRLIFSFLLSLWLVSLIYFWIWWFRSEHFVTTGGLVLNSIILLWSTAMPVYYFFFVARARVPDPTLPLPAGPVAIVVTKAPMEPWSVVKKTLEAMMGQRFPRSFDIWLADEEPSPDSIRWCAERGIRISCRKGVPGYHNPTWPRRQKCKEGNLAYFYDTYGYQCYNFVAQLDADHVPEPDYLYYMIAPFIDPAIGYVAAPSICDANASRSWTARGRLYAEAGLHGIMQAGHSAKFAPLCIGSHYAVRTCALRQIGGLGPELAEDFSTTLLFNTHGWRGSFAIHAIAHGDGPECFADVITQEFQWSRSLVKILLTLTPHCLHKLPLRLKGQFFFVQIWYLLLGGHMLLTCLFPLIALLGGSAPVSVNYIEFLVYFLSVEGCCLLLFAWLKRQGWLRPVDTRIISWEAMLFLLLRWPWVILGVVHACISVLAKRELEFRVTPKGSKDIKPLPGRILLPYMFIVMLICICSIVLQGGQADTYHYFALLNAFFYTGVIWASIIGHFLDNPQYRVKVVLHGIKGPLLQALCASLCVGIDLFVRWHEIISFFIYLRWVGGAGFLHLLINLLYYLQTTNSILQP